MRQAHTKRAQTSKSIEMSLTHDSGELYLDLMKRCLIDSIYLDDPLADMVLYREKATARPWKRPLIRGLQSFLARYRVRLVEPHSVPWMPAYATLDAATKKSLRERGLGWPSRAHTFLSMDRLDNIQYRVESALRDGIQGDLIETGVWRGGACILMRAILKVQEDSTRTVWLADSFEGLPRPNPTAYPADLGDKHHLWSDQFAVSRAEVEQNFELYGLLDDRVRFLEGWFKDTLPTVADHTLASCGSTATCTSRRWKALTNLYPAVGRRLPDRRRLRPGTLCQGHSRFPFGARDHRPDRRHRR